MSKFVIIFLALLYSFFGLFSASQDITTTASVKNSEYSQYLTTAVHDAAKEMKKTVNGSVSMPDNTAREKVMNTFYNSLALNFGYDTEEDMSRLRSYVPAVILVDTNGYYICYEHLVKENGRSYIKPIISEINTWAKTTKDGSILVRYYLGNNVDITFLKDVTVDGTTYNKGKVMSGNFLNLYKEIDDPSSANDLTSLGFNSEAAFTKAKRNCIIPDIQEKAEYYINNHNNITSSLGTDYIFEMPTTSEDDWVRVLENPTCLAFLQGIQISNTKKYLNIYALGGGEVKKGTSIAYYDEEVTNADGTKKTIRKYYNADNDIGKTPDGYLSSDIDVAKNGGEVQYDEYEDEKNNPDSDIFKDNIAKTVLHSHYYPYYTKSTGGTFIPDKNSTSTEQVDIRNQVFMKNGVYTETAPASFTYNGVTYTINTDKLGCFTEGRSSAKDKGGTKHVHVYPTYTNGGLELLINKQDALADTVLKASFIDKTGTKQASKVPARFQYNGKTYTVKAGNTGDYGNAHHHVHSELCQAYVYHQYNLSGVDLVTSATARNEQERRYVSIYGPYSRTRSGSFTSVLTDTDINNTVIGYASTDAKLDIRYLAPSYQEKLVFFWDRDENRQEAINHYKDTDQYKYGTDIERLELIDTYLRNNYYQRAKNKAYEMLKDTYITTNGSTKKFSTVDSKLQQQLLEGYVDAEHDNIISLLTDSRRYTCGYNKGDIDYYTLSCGKEEGAIENAQTEFTIDYYVPSCKHSDGEMITKKESEKIKGKLDAQGYVAP